MFLVVLLLLFSLAACKSHPSHPVEPELAETEAEPIPEPAVEIKNPEFTIVSIAIIQGELINTEFETVVRIDNPNEFAVNLASLSYTLYGNGRFWADGKAKNILYIPAKSSCETEFRFIMNFINMDRRLLDDIIAMRRVNYRFKGTVQVQVQNGLSHIPSFITNFERSGFSEVKKKAK